MDILKSIEHEQLKNKIPELKIGNTVRVHVKIKEGNKERIQVFEGIIIKEEVVPGEAEVVETVEEVPVAEPVVEEVAKTEEAKAETTATEENK